MNEPRCRRHGPWATSETDSSFAGSSGKESGNRHYGWFFCKDCPANAMTIARRECFDLAFKYGERLDGQTRLNAAIQDPMVLRQGSR